MTDAAYLAQEVGSRHGGDRRTTRDELLRMVEQAASLLTRGDGHNDADRDVRDSMALWCLTDAAGLLSDQVQDHNALGGQCVPTPRGYRLEVGAAIPDDCAPLCIAADLTVACERHAPGRGSNAWITDGWAPLKERELHT